MAIIGSVFSSLYVGSLNSAGGAFASLPPEAQELTKESVGAAQFVARQLGPNAQDYLDQVNEAFLSGLHVGCFVAAVYGAITGT